MNEKRRIWQLAAGFACVLLLQTLVYADVFSDVEACGSELWPPLRSQPE